MIFAAGITREFIVMTHDSGDVPEFLLPGAVVFTFAYYLLVHDLNETYKKIQTFFFRVPWLAYPISFLLLFTAGLYLVLIKFFGVVVDRNIFVFLGGFIATSHIIFVSSQTRGVNFGDFAAYLLNIVVYFLVGLVLLGCYFCVVFNFNVFKVFLDGVKSAIDTMHSILS